MPRESTEAKTARTRKIIAGLKRTYPDAHCANASLEDLEQEIKSAGFFRNKAKSIKSCCQALVDLHSGEVPRTMELLTELGGVGRKTANVVLGNAFHVNIGIVVDTHVARLSQRLGLTKPEDAVKIERELMTLVPQK